MEIKNLGGGTGFVRAPPAAAGECCAMSTAVPLCTYAQCLHLCISINVCERECILHGGPVKGRQLFKLIFMFNDSKPA